MPINIYGEQTQPLGYKKGPGLDSKGQAGPTLQNIADRARVNRSNAQMMENVFDLVAPLSMYSGDVEGAYLPSKTMKNAQGLAKIFQDWYKGGTPTINVPFDAWSDIIKSGKFKNQMELAGKDFPKAWENRMEIEKRLGGFPYPRTPIGPTKDLDAKYERIKQIHSQFPEIQKTKLMKDFEQAKKLEEQKPIYSESLAKKNPIYGHLYNPKYVHEKTANFFGDTYAEMSDLVKEQSKYVLGDSGGFGVFVDDAFSSEDMLGNTSKLERALFNRVKKPYLHLRPEDALKTLQTDPKQMMHLVPFMEMWVPNHLSRLNNINNVHLPKDSIYDDIDRAVSIKNLPEAIKRKLQNYKDIEDSIPSHLKGSIGPEDIIEANGLSNIFINDM